MTGAPPPSAAPRRGDTPEQWLLSLVPRPALAGVIAWRAAETLGLLTLLVGLALALAAVVGLAAAAAPAWPVLLGIAVAGALLRALGLYCGERAGARLSSDLIIRLRERLLAQAVTPQWQLQQTADPAALTLRLTRELETLEPYYRRYLPALGVALLQPLLILVLVLPLDWLAGLVLLGTAPLIPLFMVLIGMGSARLAEEQQSRLARMGAMFLDRLRGLQTLRLFRRTDSAVQDISRAAEAWRHATMRVLRVAFLSSAVLEFFAAVAIATVAIYIGLALLGFFTLGPAPEMTLAAGLVILILAPEYFAPLRRLAQHYHDRAAALAAVPALRDMAPAPGGAPGDDRHARPAAIPARRPAQRWSAPPAVRLERVTLRWPGARRPVVQHLSLTLAQGEWVALTGPSGCGKSTLAAALLGWLPVETGQIWIDDQALDAFAPEALAANLGWLGQQPQLLNAALRTNLAPSGEADASAIAALVEHCGLAGVVAALPAGLDTRLGEDGAGLSGGEAQRVALARALHRAPRVLVLDEPTASLDADHERALLERLGALRGAATIIMLTHSETAAAAADRRIELPMLERRAP